MISITTRRCLIAAAASLTLRAAAQPVFNAGDLTPPLGLTYETIQCLGEPFPAAGAGLTWNYSGISGTPMGPRLVVDPAGTTGAAFFPSATAAHDALLWDQVDYQQSTATDERYLGYHLSAGEYGICTDARIDITYPLTYGSSFTDSMVCAEVGVYSRTRHGSTTTACVGYGTLLLPGSTHTDCLLLHRTWSYFDDYDMLPAGYVNGESYSIWQVGIPIPLLVISSWTYTQDGGTVQNYSCYALSDISTGLPAPGRTALPDLAPNPTTGMVQLHDVGIEAASVMDATGRTLLERTFSTAGPVTLDLGALPTGVYTVRVYTGNGWRATRVLKQ